MKLEVGKEGNNNCPRYSEGAWLMPHTDQLITHVISAILNIDQVMIMTMMTLMIMMTLILMMTLMTLMIMTMILIQDMEEDWPLQILDHDGRLHEVTVQPGEMILYESAKLVHGRTRSLRGKFLSLIHI